MDQWGMEVDAQSSRKHRRDESGGPAALGGSREMQDLTKKIMVMEVNQTVMNTQRIRQLVGLLIRTWVIKLTHPGGGKGLGGSYQIF